MRKEFHFWFFFYYVLIEKLMQGLGEEACNIPAQEAVGDGGPAGPQQGRHDVLITVTQAWLRNQSRHKCRHPVFVLKKAHDLCLFHHETSIYLHGCIITKPNYRAVVFRSLNFLPQCSMVAAWIFFKQLGAAVIAVM